MSCGGGTSQTSAVAIQPTVMAQALLDVEEGPSWTNMLREATSHRGIGTMSYKLSGRSKHEKRAHA